MPIIPTDSVIISPSPTERKLTQINNLTPDYSRDYVDARIVSEPTQANRPVITLSFEIDHKLVPGVVVVTGELYRVTLQLQSGVWHETSRSRVGLKSVQYLGLATEQTHRTRITGLKLQYGPNDLVVASPTCSYSEPERSLFYIIATVKTRVLQRLDESTKKLLLYIFWNSPNCIVISRIRSY